MISSKICGFNKFSFGFKPELSSHMDVNDILHPCICISYLHLDYYEDFYLNEFLFWWKLRTKFEDKGSKATTVYSVVTN